MQEQEPDSPLNDPVGVEGDPVDSPAQHATDGKEVRWRVKDWVNQEVK